MTYLIIYLALGQCMYTVACFKRVMDYTMKWDRRPCFKKRLNIIHYLAGWMLGVLFWPLLLWNVSRT